MSIVQIVSDTATIVEVVTQGPQGAPGSDSLGPGTTGLISGGLLTINAGDDEKFDISAGTGKIVDYSNLANPISMDVTWSAFTAVALTDSSGTFSTIGIDENALVVQQNSNYTAQERRDRIRIGVAVHAVGAIISNASSIPINAFDPISTTVDYFSELEAKNLSGNIYSGAGTGLALDKTIGTILRYSGNYSGDVLSPNIVPVAALMATPFFRGFRDGLGGFTSSIESFLDPENYDDGSGILQPVPENFWQVFYVWNSGIINLNFTSVQQGQNIYPNKDAAQSSIALQKIDVNPNLTTSILRAAIVVKQGTTNLSAEAFFYEYDSRGLVAQSPDADVATPLNRSYPFTSSGIGAGTHYIGGFYEAPAADANLTQAAQTVTQGNAAEGHAAHAFIVAAGPGVATTGVAELEVSGTSIDSFGVRTPLDSEIIVADVSVMATNDKFETTKKWIGAVTWTLQLASGSGNFSADFNYGFAKYEDFGNRNFTLTDIESVGQGNANDPAFDIQLLHHKATGWTYSAAAFVPGTAPLVDLQTDYGAEAGVRNGQNFSYKRSGLSQMVNGNDGEGVLVRIITGAANSVQVMGTQLTVEV